MTEIERKTRAEPKWWFIVYSFGLGLVVAAAAWAGDQPGVAIFAIPWLTLFGVVLAFTPFGRLRTGSRDEGENTISNEAVIYSAYAMLAVVLIGWLWSVARGEPSPEVTVVAAVGGFAYLVALAVLPPAGSACDRNKIA